MEDTRSDGALLRKYDEMEEVCTLTKQELARLEAAGLISSFVITDAHVAAGEFEAEDVGSSSGGVTEAGRKLLATSLPEAQQ